MKSEIYKNSRESAETISFTPPAIELLSNPDQVASVWPEQVARNENFLRQLETRRELNQRLDEVLSNLPRPDMSLAEAISQNHLTENQVTNLYESLIDLLENNDDYRRIIFYLPFEFLPATSWQPSSEKLQQSAGQFRTAYMKAWGSLLNVHDVRANFVDGDILEVESRKQDLPRVVKAAHLIPKLVASGLMSIEDVLKLMKTSEDETLKRSIADTLPVLFDLGFIPETELARLKMSEDLLIHNTAASIILSENMAAKKIQPSEITLPSLTARFQKEFAKIDAEKHGDITTKRVAWIRQDKKQKAIESAGDDINIAITTKTLDDESIAQFMTPEASLASQQALIDGIRKAIESAAKTDPKQAQAIYTKYHEMLLALWEKDNPEIHHALAKTFCRLHHFGLADDRQLNKLGITIPALAGPFSENLKSMKNEMKDIQAIVAAIEADPEISQYVYPVILVFGSRLKGYGQQDADIDVGVFIKPDTTIGDSGKLKTLLKEKFAHEKIKGEVVQFWLEKTKDDLSVRDFEKHEPSIGDSSWTHILFGAAWEGNKDKISELREKLLVPYFYDQAKTIHGCEARGLYLEELERDTLQYRLMHKGYEKFFPPAGGIHTPHAGGIDGQSMFWDSGYRQVATKLFAHRVFLPKIAKS